MPVKMMPTTPRPMESHVNTMAPVITVAEQRPSRGADHSAQADQAADVWSRQLRPAPPACSPCGMIHANRGRAEALDCRTHHSLAEPLPSTGQGLGEPQLQGARLPPPCLDPPHAVKALQSRMMFPDRLLGHRSTSSLRRPETFDFFP